MFCSQKKRQGPQRCDLSVNQQDASEKGAKAKGGSHQDFCSKTNKNENTKQDGLATRRHEMTDHMFLTEHKDINWITKLKK